MKVFITDGTAEAFFTAVFDAYCERDCIISSDRQIQLALDSQTVCVDKDMQKCQRVLSAVENCDRYAADDLVLALRSCNPKKEQIAFDYIKKLLQIKRPIRKRLSLTEVIALNNLLYKVTGEAHRLKGLLRFMENADGILYAPYSPDNNITDILMRHFAERLKCERFVIHDVRRKIAGMYDGKSWIMGYADQAEICLSANEIAFVNLWKKYYKAVNIEERPHEKQMKGSMPVRYWKFLPEKQQ